MLIVLFNEAQSLDVTGPLEVFTGANRWRDSHGGGRAYDISTASPGGVPVRMSNGMRVTPDRDLHETHAPDLLIVPGGEGTRFPDRELLAWLRRNCPHISQVVSVCTGAFLLAEVGVLAGRRATTHWAHCDALAERYPRTTVEADPIFVRDGDVATSAGVTAGIDLALSLVEEDIGRDAALAVARNLVVFLRRPGNQAQFSTQLAAQTAQRAPLRRLQQWIAEHPEADLSVETLAERANLSPRQFARAFTSEVGMTPGRYVDRVRLEAARRRLEDTGEGVAETARACGYGTPEAMRRAFLRVLGTGPHEYRQRFHPVPAASNYERKNDADSHPAV